MANQELAKIFYELADFLDLEGIQFKPRAYRRVAFQLKLLEKDVEDIYKEEGLAGLKDIPGVGKNIAGEIVEYLEKGKIKKHQKYRKKHPFSVNEIMRIEGVGPKTAKILFKKLKIKNIRELEKAIKEGKLKKLSNFGPKKEKNILEGIKFLKKEKGKMLLDSAFLSAEGLIRRMKKIKGVKKVVACGSLRRRKELIGDIDFLASADHSLKLMEKFCSFPEVVKIWNKGKTKSSVRLKSGFDLDLRVVPAKSFGSALQYFTGSRKHNIKMRKIAGNKGFKLNEYGLFKKGKMVAGKKEKEIYSSLGMSLPPPELREDRGEVEAALKDELPCLVNLKEIKGDLHSHSDWDGGADSIEEMAEKAKKLGYQYLGISDHTKFLKIEKGLDEEKLLKQNKEIKRINKKLKGFKILHGCEANILNDGSLDINDEILAKMDYVIAGVHSSFKMSEEAMTERIIRAVKNPHVKIISHLTGRLLLKRDGYKLDIEKIFKTAEKEKVILEINASPKRLDLNDFNVREAIKRGIKLIIGSDAHQKSQLELMKYGIFTARRGWAEKKDILNTLPLLKLIKFLK